MELLAKFANVAKAKGVPMSELFIRYMQQETGGVSITEEQLKGINKRMKNAAVTPADIAGVIAENTLTLVEHHARLVSHPTLRDIETPLPELTTIPKLGSRKKKKRP